MIKYILLWELFCKWVILTMYTYFLCFWLGTGNLWSLFQRQEKLSQFGILTQIKEICCSSQSQNNILARSLVGVPWHPDTQLTSQPESISSYILHMSRSCPESKWVISWSFFFQEKFCKFCRAEFTKLTIMSFTIPLGINSLPSMCIGSCNFFMIAFLASPPPFFFFFFSICSNLCCLFLLFIKNFGKF